MTQLGLVPQEFSLNKDVPKSWFLVIFFLEVKTSTWNSERSPKSYDRIRFGTLPILSGNDSDSCLDWTDSRVKSFFDRAVGAQMGATYQRFPGIWPKGSVPVMTVCYHRIQGAGTVGQQDLISGVVRPHSEAEFCEGYTPVGRRLHLLWVETTWSCCYIVDTFVTPQRRRVNEVRLKGNK